MAAAVANVVFGGDLDEFSAVSIRINDTSYRCCIVGDKDGTDGLPL